jgi:F0F1-type ATP synthase assembly protein I
VGLETPRPVSLRKISQSPKFRREMSGDHDAPSSENTRAGQPRQKMPAASPPPLPDDGMRRERSSAARYAGAGLQFAITLLVGLGIGNWADKRFGTSYFVPIGVFVGAGAAFYSMYRQLMGNLERDEKAKRARARAAAESSAAEQKKHEPGEGT